MTTNAGTVSTQEALQLVIAMHRLLRCLRKSADIAAPHPTRFIVLDLLARHGSLRIGELAARIPCPQPTATITVAGLQTAGLVTRESDPADGRAARVLITEDGRRTLHSAAQREAEALAALLSTVDQEGLRILRAAIPLLSGFAENATTAARINQALTSPSEPCRTPSRAVWEGRRISGLTRPGPGRNCEP